MDRKASPTELAEQLDLLAKAHVKRARSHTLALGPILEVVRDEYLYSFLHYDSFEEWLSQGELDMRANTASHIINYWQIAVPACEQIGMPISEFVEKVSPGKAQLVLRPIRQAQERGTPMSTEDIKDLFYAAETMPYNELITYVKPSGAHVNTKADEDNPQFLPPNSDGVLEEPLIKIQVVERMGQFFECRFRTDEAGMEFIQRRVRPTWVDSNGEILRVTKKPEE